jgi:methyl-accepting chemotaxis protein
MKAEITAAINAHGAWKEKLKAAIETGKSESIPDSVAPDSNCAFGKWLYSLNGAEIQSENYTEVKDLHAQFHKAAANVLKIALSGQKEEATKQMDLGSDYVKASSNLILAMGRWGRSVVE